MYSSIWGDLWSNWAGQVQLVFKVKFGDQWCFKREFHEGFLSSPYNVLTYLGLQAQEKPRAWNLGVFLSVYV
jgi:hypothetical protein